MQPIIRDLKDSCLFEEDHTYLCYNCGNVINHKAAKRFVFNYGAGGSMLCMTCLFRLHLELNDIFEQAPGLSLMMRRVHK